MRVTQCETRNQTEAASLGEKLKMNAYQVTGSDRAKSFDICCIDPARGSVESDCFLAAEWTVEDAVETFCSEYGLTHDQIRVEWNMDDVDALDGAVGGL